MEFLPKRSPCLTFQCVFVLIFWIGLICIAETKAGGEFGELLRRGGSEQREFDYFKLSLQWPGTFCRKTRHCCSSNGCCRGSNSPAEFTIHGLWPDYNDGTWPACCSGKRFDVKEISTLRDDLNKYWPSLSCGSSSNCHGGKGLFWEHEITNIVSIFLPYLIGTTLMTVGCVVEKHGTCSSAVTGNEYDYFVTALNIYFHYNVTEVLINEGYVASDSEKYPLGGIISAVQNAFHLTPEVQCTGDSVEELRLCFYKDFKPRDCANDTNSLSSMVNAKGSCPNYVRLPAYFSLRNGINRIGESQSPSLSSI
ncbi:ribonuclease 2-like [Dorcoceras hygrometricum]|uniref:Ribonuclease 2-like n=1 Tax=Dorcoceras hygrometricum TaxID=472368 RepID=A0A2Z7BDA0_9LAMI|nr:ribonuclease 2-like [Dorcoceras hygrometricum]